MNLAKTILVKGPQFVVQVLRPRLTTFVKYARVELMPPSPSELSQIGQGFGKLMNSAKTGKWKQLTVKEATLNVLIAMEIAFWFFLGEIIGRRHFYGYFVPP